MRPTPWNLLLLPALLGAVPAPERVVLAMGTRLELQIGDPAAQERALAAKQAVAGLEAALARLDALDREALAFAAAGELSYAEIAGLLGLSEASLKVRIHRARLRLRELMKENGHAG